MTPALLCSFAAGGGGLGLLLGLWEFCADDGGVDFFSTLPDDAERKNKKITANKVKHIIMKTFPITLRALRKL